MAERKVHGRDFSIGSMSLQRPPGFRVVKVMIPTLQMRNKLQLLHILSLLMQA